MRIEHEVGKPLHVEFADFAVGNHVKIRRAGKVASCVVVEFDPMSTVTLRDADSGEMLYLVSLDFFAMVVDGSHGRSDEEAAPVAREPTTEPIAFDMAAPLGDKPAAFYSGWARHLTLSFYISRIGYVRISLTNASLERVLTRYRGDAVRHGHTWHPASSALRRALSIVRRAREDDHALAENCGEPAIAALLIEHSRYRPRASKESQNSSDEDDWSTVL